MFENYCIYYKVLDKNLQQMHCFRQTVFARVIRNIISNTCAKGGSGGFFLVISFVYSFTSCWTNRKLLDKNLYKNYGTFLQDLQKTS